MPDAGDEPLPWEVLTRRTVYTGRLVNVAHWSVRLPDGSVIPGEIRRLVVDNAIPDGLTVTSLGWALVAWLIGEKGERWQTTDR